ncbi:MAG: type IX secretion system membrane protein PorP/SprF [Bacteroidetes bacterium]|nr:MAG: type IX secretion system membrane protein PorP/SprF [Bacteroidota bacterium]
MLKRLSKILIFLFIIPAECFSQEIDTGPGYQMIMMNNPAFSGSEGAGVIRMSYLNHYPGNNYNLHTVYFSYDTYLPMLHGGAGFYLSDDYLGGIVNDLRGGLSYSYFLQADKDLFINAGLSASFYRRGYNFNKAVFPDQIDPLGGVSIPSSEMLASNGKTVFDIGAGFLFIFRNVFAGFSINHLAEPGLSATDNINDKLKRKLLLHLSSDFNLNKKQNLKIRPQIYLGLQRGFLTAGAGAELEGNILSVNTIFIGDNGKNMNIQTGFSLKSGKICVYYNYRFNIVSGNSLMPLSLLHQTGLAFSLNNVDKRNLIKTINFPKL